MVEKGLIEKEISIHALRGEGDDEFKDNSEEYKISIHALRGEGDPQCWHRPS